MRWSLVTASLCAFAAAYLPATAGARVRSNTQARLPNNLYTADLTGDGVAEFLAVKDDKILVADTTFNPRGMIYTKVGKNIKRMITGSFGGGAKEQVCAVVYNGLFTNDSIICYGTDPNNTTLWWWFTQDSILSDSEEAIVGDFDGNGRDDILVYNAGSGTVRMYTVSGNAFFGAMAGFAPGNLVNIANAQVYAGELSRGAGSRRDDVIVYWPNSGQLARYEAVTDGGGFKTFWWAFTTYAGAVSASEDLAIANVDGDNTEDLVLRNRTSGTYRFLATEWGSGYLTAINNVLVGQLNNSTTARMYWSHLKQIPNESGGLVRDDALIYDTNAQWFVRSDGRFDGTRFTYYWVYTQWALNLDDDRDGDGIKTLHELGGYDANNDGVSDEFLPSYGVSPFVRDVLVEVDWMAADPNQGETLSHQPDNAAVNNAIAEYAKGGINLHVLVSNQISHTTTLGSMDIFGQYQWGDFDTIKNANFARSRVPFFHYCVFGHFYGGGGTSSGISRGIGGSDFLVTHGGFGDHRGSAGQQTGTFLHELGHNMGLHHGGTDDTNFKPNFLSIMNYQYQFDGIMKDGVRQWLYSELLTSALNEGSLSEWNGVTATQPGGHVWRVLYNGAWTNVNLSIDWNMNGYFQSGVSRDINGDNGIGTLAGSPNEYGMLNFRGGSVGSAGAAAGESPTADYTRQDQPISALTAHHHKPVKMDELDITTYEKKVRPHFAKIAEADLGKHQHAVPVLQPLELDPIMNDPSRR